MDRAGDILTADLVLNFVRRDIQETLTGELGNPLACEGIDVRFVSRGDRSLDFDIIFLTGDRFVRDFRTGMCFLERSDLCFDPAVDAFLTRTGHTQACRRNSGGSSSLTASNERKQSRQKCS